MTNYYLKGFKLGFQPNRHTAEKVYHEIIQRKPDFLDKQIPNNLSKLQVQNLGQFEGDFLTNEIDVDKHNITFSNLAKELLFSDVPALDVDDVAIENASIKSDTLANDANKQVSEIDYKSNKKYEEEISL